MNVTSSDTLGGSGPICLLPMARRRLTGLVLRLISSTYVNQLALNILFPVLVNGGRGFGKGDRLQFELERVQPYEVWENYLFVWKNVCFML